VLLLGLESPDEDSLEVLIQLRDLPARPPVLIFSSHTDRHQVVRAFKLGVNGYYIKVCLLDTDLITEVHKVAGGGRYVSEELVDDLITGFTEETRTYLTKACPIASTR